MQTVSSTYTRLIAQENHYFVTNLIISDSIVLQPNKIFSITTRSEIFKGAPKVGQAIAQEIDASFIAPLEDIPPMASIKLYTRVVAGNEYSEWIAQGIYYIDTRSVTRNDDGLDIMTVHGFDAMLKAEQDYDSTRLNWPARDVNIVAEIASKMGISVDSRTNALMTSAFTLPLPTGYSLREMLGYIASMYCGCFIITERGALRLVSLTELPPETNLLITREGDVITFGGDAILV